LQATDDTDDTTDADDTKDADDTDDKQVSASSVWSVAG